MASYFPLPASNLKQRRQSRPPRKPLRKCHALISTLSRISSPEQFTLGGCWLSDSARDSVSISMCYSIFSATTALTLPLGSLFYIRDLVHGIPNWLQSLLRRLAGIKPSQGGPVNSESHHRSERARGHTHTLSVRRDEVLGLGSTGIDTRERRVCAADGSSAQIPQEQQHATSNKTSKNSSRIKGWLDRQSGSSPGKRLGDES
ncbi:hypothetical protein MAPG_03436 [Magnaporthiopsis poae ATCC 64411]|uniref:Uncharacterized protein n=1 Tax=Magnaporthiopsis poae (strain ATCC 64411 / 73-15) TaxID=644358 RepID=A0A0C4DU05_MAGP6|nr:hypothetical protein MAPG_03436 [Magnaporthiopsis poae ATCC 64411]